MKSNELETIVMKIIISIEKEIEAWKESESLKISDLQTQFTELLGQLESLDDLQMRLRNLLQELNQTASKVKNL